MARHDLTTSKAKKRRRWNAVVRQHDMWVRYYDMRKADRGHLGYLPAPVDEFLAQGEDFCPGNHGADDPCDGEV